MTRQWQTVVSWWAMSPLEMLEQTEGSSCCRTSTWTERGLARPATSPPLSPTLLLLLSDLKILLKVRLEYLVCSTLTSFPLED